VGSPVSQVQRGRVGFPAFQGRILARPVTRDFQVTQASLVPQGLREPMERRGLAAFQASQVTRDSPAHLGIQVLVAHQVIRVSQGQVGTAASPAIPVLVGTQVFRVIPVSPDTLVTREFPVTQDSLGLRVTPASLAQVVIQGFPDLLDIAGFRVNLVTPVFRGTVGFLVTQASLVRAPRGFLDSVVFLGILASAGRVGTQASPGLAGILGSQVIQDSRELAAFLAQHSADFPSLKTPFSTK